jgi:hypothetical protein
MNTRPLQAALKRLAASDTPRKRKNALAAFAAAVKTIEANVKTAFPKLRADGTAIVPKKTRGARCPLCNVPTKSFRMLIDHMHNKHLKFMPNDWSCQCGKLFGGGATSKRRLAAHLANVPDLKIHFAEIALRMAAGLPFQKR